MALTNLSDVTSTLMNLISLYYTELTGGGVVTVVPQTPEKVESSTTPTISVYLYHAREDAHYKNAEPAGGTVANTPLALSLYYVITAHQSDDSLPVPLLEQALMGYALRALHDFPIITDTTEIDGDLVMFEGMRGGANKLQIIYRPITPEDAVTFWNGDDGRLIRFSAFYEVRVVFMEHVKPTHLPGFVLSVGNYILPTGVMSIVSSEGVVRFTPPGGATTALVATPARVALSAVDPAPGEAPNNQLTLRGTRLGGGQLVLRSPLFDTPNNQIAVVPALNAGWSISVTPSRLVARIGGSLARPDLPPQPILPGIYGASVQVSSTYQLPGGLTKTLVTRSNEVAIAVTPAITTHGSIGAALPVVVDLEVDSQTDLIASELDTEISVVVSSQVYKRVIDIPPPGLHEFKVDGNTIQIGVPFTSSDLGIYPVRLIIRGVEAPPYWIEIT